MRVFYVWDDKLIEQCDRLPAVIGRASLVHSLITAYELLKHVQVVRCTPAKYDELKEFHSELYLDHLKTFVDVDDDYMSSAQDEEFGIGYDCPPVSNMFELVCTIAGGSITAAKCIVRGLADVAINWCGGWHHAQRFGADGFCYVNDIVLAIEQLRTKFPKVLYVDLDVHHGNGVEDAYNISKSVFTLSLHKYEPGFYPGSGGVMDIGTLVGKGYSCNVPLHAKYSDDTLNFMFEKVIETVWELFMPDAVVVQCGADALAHDPHGGASLSIQGYCSCVHKILNKQKPTLLLGGGGYKHPNAARLWTSLTALVAGVTLNENIPEHEDWPSYGPDYMLPVEPTLARDSNNKSYLEDCLKTILCNLKNTFETIPIDNELEKNKLNASLRPNHHENLDHLDKQNNCDIVQNNASQEQKIVISKGENVPSVSNHNSTDTEDIYAFTED